MLPREIWLLQRKPQQPLQRSGLLQRQVGCSTNREDQQWRPEELCTGVGTAQDR